jgi:hypothetical protein
MIVEVLCSQPILIRFSSLDYHLSSEQDFSSLTYPQWLANYIKMGMQEGDADFHYFYAGINLGAFLGGYICVAIGKGYMLSNVIDEAHRWNVAFGLPRLA